MMAKEKEGEVEKKSKTKKRSKHLQAQPTQRKNTTNTLLPPPNSIFLSLSSGARSPTLGHSAATGTGGGGGDSQACAVSGRFLTVIHLGQPLAFAASASSWPGGFFLSLLGSVDDDPPVSADMSSAFLGMPIFFMASLVASPLNILTVFLVVFFWVGWALGISCVVLFSLGLGDLEGFLSFCKFVLFQF